MEPLIKRSLIAVLLLATCARGPLDRDNPLDSDGTNWHPPMVTMMGDSAVLVLDSFYVHALGRDSNGTVAKYLWAINHTEYSDTTEIGRVLTGFPDTGTFTVRVKVLDNDGLVSAADSCAITVSFATAAPPAPSITSVVGGDSSVTVTWNHASGAVSYNLYYAEGATVDTTGATKLTGATSPKQVVGLTNGTTYAFAVSAVNAMGESGPSNTATAVPQAPVDTSACLGAPPAGMKCIKGGAFTMGSNDPLDNDASPSHQVIVATFYMDSTEVTQARYQAAMAVNPSHFTGDLSRPVEQVTWFDAVLFCNARSRLGGDETVYTYTKILGTPGKGCTGLVNLGFDFTKTGYRLPTEAEWEYACRAGSATAFYWGGDSTVAGNYAWFSVNSNGTTLPVATKQPNARGLYDMAGNVWEWCNDWYGTYTTTAETDPTGPATGTSRVLRGGSWYNTSSVALRSAYRASYAPDSGHINDGFRCVSR